MSSYKVLIGATGSVASIKVPILVDRILDLNRCDGKIKFEVRVIVTEHAKHFFSVIDLPSQVPVYDDEAEWSSWRNRGDPVLHIELGKWADLMVIAPLDANTLAKMAQGICDNLLTCTTRAWDMSKPLLFCPAMNTRMWEHPLTSQHIAALARWGHTEVPPITKTLICGDTGVGAMAEADVIVDHIRTVSGYESI